MPVLDQIFVGRADIHLQNKEAKITKNFNNNMFL